MAGVRKGKADAGSCCQRGLLLQQLTRDAAQHALGER